VDAGFRSLNHAQLLNDLCYYPDVIEPQQWLIYYISKPLVGSLEQIPLLPAQIQPRGSKDHDPMQKAGPSPPATTPGSSATTRKKSVGTFNELLVLFPLIARSMQGDLEDIYVKFGRSFEKPLPPSPPSSAVPSISSTSSSIAGDETAGVSFVADRLGNNGYRGMKSVVDEHTIRRALEISISSAIELFQKVDSSQLSLIASTTDLTGSAVERLIERHVAEQLHDSLLFPRVCSTKREEDEELERKIKAMENVDLTQVGIPSLDQRSKLGLVRRLTRGIEDFRKIGSAKSPHAMTEILLETAQSLTRIDEIVLPSDESEGANSEKESLENGNTTIVTMNADTLVSLLLIVVIRSKVPHLSACLSYMRNYVFVDNVEQGEIGYILSTLEAVIYHIVQDNDQLSLASSRNRELWRCIKKGNVDGVRKILEPSDTEDQAESSRDASSGDSGSYMENFKIAGEALENDSPNLSDEEEAIEASPPSITEVLEEELDATQHKETIENGVEESSEGLFAKGEDLPDVQHDATNDISKLATWNGGGVVPIEIDGEDGSEAEGDVVVKNMEMLSPAQNPDATPPVSTEAEENRGYPMDNAQGPTAANHNGFIQGKENEPFPLVEVFTKRSHFSASASMVSLATTVRDSLSLNQISRTHTSASHNTSNSQAADILSIEKLSRTRNANGDSILMMAIQDRQPEVFRYLLDCPYFPMAFVLDDDNNDGTTLLCAAVQIQNNEVVEILLDVLMKLPEATLRQYFQRTDNAGRTVGHYLFQ